MRHRGGRRRAGRDAVDERQFALTLTQREAFEFVVRFDRAGVPALAMDEPPPLGEGRDPNAARVLGAAVGHCLSASLLFCLRKSRIEVSGMETKVNGTIERNAQGRLRIGEIAVELSPQVPVKDRERLARCVEIFEQFCLVTQSVREGIDVRVAVAGQGIPATT